jgi:outer membrane protein assembly factor BamA
MRIFSRALTTLLFLAPFAALAQTYTPRHIRIDAPPGVDTAEALRIAALPSGVPLTKEQIETALQHLADTGLFSDIGYTVNSDALVIKLTPSASSQLQPVHFANFVWWQPAELETLVEASVPGYHGQLPLAGTLTDQVKAALVSLLHTKGVDATVEARQSGAAAAIVTLSITNPSILIDKVNLENQLPDLKRLLQHFADSLHTQDFDTDETTRTIHDSAGDIYQNAGYLDVAITAPTVSAPHKDLLNYAVDLTSTIQPGELYHVSSFSVQAAPPLSQAELEKAAAIKPGDTASPLAQRIAQGEMQKAYNDQGYLEAKASIETSKDSTAHTIAYTTTFVPGEVYHLARVDTSALSSEQQSAFAQRFHIAAGTVAGGSLNAEIARTLNDMHALKTVKYGVTLDRTHHTITIMLTPAAAH